MNLIITDLARFAEEWKRELAEGKGLSMESAVTMYTAVIELEEENRALRKKLAEPLGGLPKMFE